MLRLRRLVRKSPLSPPFSSSSPFDIGHFFRKGHWNAAVPAPTLTDGGSYLAVVLGAGQAHAVYKLSLPWASPPRAGPWVEGEAATAAVNILRSSGDSTDREAHEVVLGAVKEGNMVVSTRLSPITRSNSEWPHRKGCRFLLQLSIWPREGHAFATLFQKKGKKGEWLWQSTFCYNMEPISCKTGIVFSYQTGLVTIKSEHPDRRLEYKGLVSDSLISSFKISLESHFTVQDFLGSGGEGEVRRCVYHLDSHECAVKGFYYEGLLQKEPRESSTMKYFCHGNIKRMFCSWKEEDKGAELNTDVHIYIAQELCKCALDGFLDGKIDIDLTQRQRIFNEVVTGLAHIHQYGMAHRDIKSSNIFLNDNFNAKIGDFGQGECNLKSLDLSVHNLEKNHDLSVTYLLVLAAFVNSNSFMGGRFYGTVFYSSPEMSNHMPHNEKTDIFSLGVLYYELFGPSGNMIERSVNLAKLRVMLSGEDWKRSPIRAWSKFQLSEQWMGELILLISMLQRSPERRPCCAEIMENNATCFNEAHTNPIKRWLHRVIKKCSGYFRRS